MLFFVVVTLYAERSHYVRFPRAFLLLVWGLFLLKKSTPFICRKITHYTTLYYIYKYFIFMAGFIVRFSYVPFSAALASNISCSRLNRLYITMKVTGIAAIIRGVVKELNVQVLCVSSLKLFHSSQYLFLCTPYAPDLRTPLGLRKKTRGKKEKGAKNHQKKMWAVSFLRHIAAWRNTN